MPYDDFREITRLSEVFHRAQVMGDLNNDMAGRETGRIRRRTARDPQGLPAQWWFEACRPSYECARQ